MAKIVESMGYSELLGKNTREFIEEEITEETGEDKMENILRNLDNRHLILNRMSKNNKKSYNKGVIKVEVTCNNCGRRFPVQMTYKQYHNLLLLHMDTINREKRIATGIEIARMFTTIGVRILAKEVFLFELCPGCISKWKCRKLGKNATNVEKNSL